jgi:beta-phosphoglucomutase family hydrolase
MSPTNSNAKSLVGGVLWDMDGVLVDTGEFHYQAWQVVLQEFDIPFDRARFKATFGMNNTDLITALQGSAPTPESVARISERKEKLFRQAIRGKAQLLPGTLGWLSWLQANGIPQAIASSAPCENIAALVDELGIRDYFQAILSGADIPGKPDPAVFLAAAHKLNLSPADCLVIEDSVAGVTAARRAGMRCLAVTTTNPPERLAQADWIIDTLEELTIQDFTGLWNAR